MKNASDYTDEEANDMTEIELEMYREAVDEAEAALAEIESVNQTGTARHPYLSETPGVTCISMFCVSLSPVFISQQKLQLRWRIRRSGDLRDHQRSGAGSR
jgi:hypothetical protein